MGMTRAEEALTVDVAGLAAEHGHGKKSELCEYMWQSGLVLVMQGTRRPHRAECPRGPAKRAGAEIIARIRRARMNPFAYLRPSSARACRHCRSRHVGVTHTIFDMEIAQRPSLSKSGGPRTVP